VLEFCTNPSAKTVLLRGPIGTGKSTLARAIGFAKRVLPLTKDEAELWMTERVRYDAPGRVDFRLMDWYVELALTGLVVQLAEAQLFGVAKKAATGVDERAGVFERAVTGTSGSRGDPSVGSRVTGGVVFLDEIGDLPPALQAKLLPVLSGGVFYRVGGEGKRLYEQQFKGITIVASWRSLDDGLMRADLLSRISAHMIDVPDLTERREDLPSLIDGLEHDLIARYREELEDLCLSDPKADRAFWSKRHESVEALSQAEKDLLLGVDWGRFGNLRGLANALERVVIGGQDAHSVIGRLQPIEERIHRDSSNPRMLLGRVLSRRPDGTGLISHVKEIQREERKALRDLLTVDPQARRNVGRALGIEEARLPSHIQQLDRDRRTRRGA
jgi:DNA-binding NtrC family response regulator